MRAKNEFRNIAANYDTKLILERVVDGKLMCPEACCGAPVVECTCGPDCPHCNCFMIHKAMKEKGFTNKLLKENAEESTSDDYDAELPVGHYDTHVRLQRGGRWNAHTVNVRKTDKELIQKFLDQGFRIVKPPEDGEDDPYGILDATVRDFEQELDIQGDGIDTNVNELKDYVDIIKGLDIVEKQRESALNYLKNLRGPGGRAGLEDVDFEFVFGEEDKVDIDKIDLNKWREYPSEDVMKAVYRRYGRELPSVDSKDYNITWDKKIRPWLIEHEGTF